jgi:hypothetical protein
MVGIDKGEFHGLAEILAGRVQGVAMEKHGIARSQARRLGTAEYGGIVPAIGTKELRLVEPIGVKRGPVGARYEPERTVVDGLVAERKPHRDEILVRLPYRGCLVMRQL